MASSIDKENGVMTHPRGSLRYQAELRANRMTDKQLHKALDFWREHHYSGPVKRGSDGSVIRVDSEPGPWRVYGLCEQGVVLSDGHSDYWVPWVDLHECLTSRSGGEGQGTTH